MSRFIRLFIGIILVFIGMAGLIFYYSAGGFQFQWPMGMGRGMGMGGTTGGMMRNMEEIDRRTEFSSNGERIFFRGMNSKGEFVKNSHGMQGVGCAMCHGVDAQGMQMMMDVPPLRWSYLTGPKGHKHPNGRNHPSFTEASFKSCVIAGIDPEGNELSAMMPRWQMSNEDLDSVIDYLKKLPEQPA